MYHFYKKYLFDHFILILNKELDSLNGSSSSLGDGKLESTLPWEMQLSNGQCRRVLGQGAQVPEKPSRTPMRMPMHKCGCVTSAADAAEPSHNRVQRLAIGMAHT